MRSDSISAGRAGGAEEGDKIEVRGRIELVQTAFIEIHNAKLLMLKE